MKKVTILTTAFLVIVPFTSLLGQRGYYETVEEEFKASTDQPLEVLLKVDAGEVFVEKGEDEHIGVVTIRYAPRKFRQRVEFDDTKNRLKIYFEMKGLKTVDTDEDPAEVTLQLPHGVDILFDSKIKAGEVTMEMGGLQLHEFYLDNWAGEVEIRFDEPNPVVMDFLGVNAKVGALRLVKLGNARFTKADINGGIGEIDIDFTGDLQNESQAKVDLDIGEASILLPHDVGIRMKIGGGLSFLSQKNIDRSLYSRGSIYYSEDYDETEKKFAIRVTPGLGELNIDRN